MPEHVPSEIYETNKQSNKQTNKNIQQGPRETLVGVNPRDSEKEFMTNTQ
jgi:hypothetical protein